MQNFLDFETVSIHGYLRLISFHWKGLYEFRRFNYEQYFLQGPRTFVKWEPLLQIHLANDQV